MGTALFVRLSVCGSIYVYRCRALLVTGCTCIYAYNLAFLQHKLGFAETELPMITSAYRFGKGLHRPLSFKLLDPNDGAQIYSHTKYLKDVVNDFDKPFFIDEQLTEQQMEKKKCQRQIKKENRAMPISHQFDINVKGNEMTLDGDKYVKMVDPPTAKQLLLAPTSIQDEFRATNMHQGSEKQHGTSKFKVYVAEVHSFNDIKQAYVKVKEANFGASHIPCGYHLFRKDFPFKQDYADDTETGAGQTILDELKSYGVFNVSLFIARFYDGQYISRARFDIIKQLTKDALASYPGPLCYGHNFKDQATLKALRAAVCRNKS